MSAPDDVAPPLPPPPPPLPAPALLPPPPADDVLVLAASLVLVLVMGDPPVPVVPLLLDAPLVVEVPLVLVVVPLLLDALPVVEALVVLVVVPLPVLLDVCELGPPSALTAPPDPPLAPELVDAADAGLADVVLSATGVVSSAEPQATKEATPTSHPRREPRDRTARVLIMGKETRPL